MEELIMVGFWALDQLGRTGIKVSCFDMTWKSEVLSVFFEMLKEDKEIPR
jgi:hypothetical protein